MKKKIIIAAILISSFSLYGCSTAPVEIEPVTISDTQEQENDVSVTPTGASATGASTEISSETSPDDSTDSSTIDTSNYTDDVVFPAEISIEGSEETITCKTYKSELGYSVGYDIDRFTASSKDGIDTYMAENSNPELYPYVYMSVRNLSTKESYEKSDNPLSGYVSKEEDENANKPVIYDVDGNIVGLVANKNWESNKNSEFNSKYLIPFETTPETVETINVAGYEAYHYTVSKGTDWNSKVTEYYYIVKDNQIFQVQLHYFFEATEGFGARLKAMLDTFTVTE